LLVFSRRERLPRALFPTALKTGRRLSSPNFSAVVSSDVRGHAVIIPKKIARLSVTRHRIKRRVFAALKTLPLPPSVVIFPKSSAGSVSYEDTRKEIAALLSK
jgi:ribonuclease P protein component